MSTIILCEYSGEVAQAFRDKGESAWSCDLLAGERPKYHIEGDAYSALTAGRPTDGAKWTKAGLHWPCTYFTNSGVRWLYFRGTRARVEERWLQMTESADGLCQIIRHLLANGIPFYFENPVMHKYAREAIIARLPWFATAQYQVVQPWHFGTWETKATCLWLYRLPPLTPKYRTQDECRIALGLPKFIEKNGVMVKNKPVAKVHLASPGPNRGHERSRTLPTLARAMADQWGGTTK